MLSYIQNNLLPNEKVITIGDIHWIIHLPGGFILFIALMFFIENSPITGLILLIGFYFLAKSIIYNISTELGVTSKRVIAKFGFIRRNTVDLNFRHVESIKVSQGILGRLLNYGTIRISGTGGESAPIPGIADPLGFRKAVLTEIDAL